MDNYSPDDVPVTEPPPATEPSNHSESPPAKKKGWLFDWLSFAVLLIAGGAMCLLMMFYFEQNLWGLGREQSQTETENKPAEQNQRPGRDRAALFQRLDKNKDNKITKEEGGRAWRILQAADKNGDDAVTQEEWKAAPRRGARRGGNGNGQQDGRIPESVFRTVSAGRAIFPGRMMKLPEDTEVLGLSLNDMDRAYVVKAFEGEGAYVVQDNLVDVMITITHNFKTGQSRAFRDKKNPDGPLDIEFGGWHRDSKDDMLLKVRSQYYVHKTTKPAYNDSGPAFSYDEQPVVRTTWKKWYADHPETSVYIGYASGMSKYKQLITSDPANTGNPYRSLLYALPFLPAALMLLVILVRWLTRDVGRRTLAKPA